jgi:hypothetical protein
MYCLSFPVILDSINAVLYHSIFMEKTASLQNASHPSKLLDHVRAEIRLRHSSHRTRDFHFRGKVEKALNTDRTLFRGI